MEPAKLRALRIHVPTCLACSRAHVSCVLGLLTYQRVLHGNVPSVLTWQRALRAYVPTRFANICEEHPIGLVIDTVAN